MQSTKTLIMLQTFSFKEGFLDVEKNLMMRRQKRIDLLIFSVINYVIFISSSSFEKKNTLS